MTTLERRLRHLLRIWKTTLRSDSEMKKYSKNRKSDVAWYYRGSKDALTLAITQLEEVIRGK